jgi:hypothetical protein
MNLNLILRQHAKIESTVLDEVGRSGFTSWFRENVVQETLTFLDGFRGWTFVFSSFTPGNQKINLY